MKKGRRNYYTPCISREEYLAAQSRSFLEKLCGGSLSVFPEAYQRQSLRDALGNPQLSVYHDPGLYAAARTAFIINLYPFIPLTKMG